MAGIVWYAGGFILPVKAFDLLLSASVLIPGSIWVWIAPALGIGLGLGKTLLLFDRNCRNNLKRIETLSRPRIWEFYRPSFFIFLALMITAGTWMSREAEGSFTALVTVAVLDLSIGTALLVSGRQFWMKTADSGE